MGDRPSVEKHKGPQPAPQRSTTPSLSANLGDVLVSLKAKGILSGAASTPVNGSHGYAPLSVGDCGVLEGL